MLVRLQDRGVFADGLVNILDPLMQGGPEAQIAFQFEFGEEVVGVDLLVRRIDAVNQAKALDKPNRIEMQVIVKDADNSGNDYV